MIFGFGARIQIAEQINYSLLTQSPKAASPNIQTIVTFIVKKITYIHNNRL
ncbi:hypothetical protein Back11_00930 [Paenibacillus baekrokdamisoli]|uniref:Uncharacterized protein n=1 Tax=Paenibacillus baekrokdamisoli TaxID=1712516 RepID=A0A3G9J4Z4_9BACL|nr:hypothetical protein [Paenibacillus baekrokdamisoli]BBH18748.1 hypothetical protein Back11_00930 [Paenibacillus baekrokdamisoli]